LKKSPILKNFTFFLVPRVPFVQFLFKYLIYNNLINKSMGQAKSKTAFPAKLWDSVGQGLPVWDKKRS